MAEQPRQTTQTNLFRQDSSGAESDYICEEDFVEPMSSKTHKSDVEFIISTNKNVVQNNKHLHGVFGVGNESHSAPVSREQTSTLDSENDDFNISKGLVRSFSFSWEQEEKKETMNLSYLQNEEERTRDSEQVTAIAAPPIADEHPEVEVISEDDEMETTILLTTAPVLDTTQTKTQSQVTPPRAGQKFVAQHFLLTPQATFDDTDSVTDAERGNSQGNSPTRRMEEGATNEVNTRSPSAPGELVRPVAALPTTLFLQWPHLVFVCPMVLYSVILLLYPVNCATVDADKQPHCCKEPLVSYLVEPDYSYGIFNLAMGQYLVFAFMLWSELFRIRMQDDKYATERRLETRYKISNFLLWSRYAELFWLAIWSVTRIQTSYIWHRNGAVAFGLFNYCGDVVDTLFWPSKKKQYWVLAATFVAGTLFLINPMNILPLKGSSAFVLLEHGSFILSTCYCMLTYSEFARAQQGYRSLR